jgi:hypothetical protein
VTVIDGLASREEVPAEGEDIIVALDGLDERAVRKIHAMDGTPENDNGRS